MASRNLPYAFDVDANFYYATYPDVAASGVAPARHFHIYGWHEGRNPDSFFDTAGYLASNPDVAAAGIDPLAHFHRIGYMEGRLSSPAFDSAAYLAANPDVAAAGVDPLAHYLHYGQFEGRAAIAAPLFDADAAGNTVGGHALAGTATGVTFSWGGFVSPNLTYALTGDTSGGGFTVDPHTGQVIVADSSKVADNTNYAVTVTASDLGHSISQSATINVGAEANNYAPAFDKAPPLDGVQTNEGFPTTGTIYDAHATDADQTAPNNTVTYSLAAGVGDNDAFNIGPDGKIHFNNAPDYENPADKDHDNTYVVTVTATDGGNPAHSVTETISIHVQDNPNDNGDTGTNPGDPQAKVASANHVSKFVTVDNDSFHFASSQGASQASAGVGTSSAPVASHADDHAAGGAPQDHADAPHWTEIAHAHGWGADAAPDADAHAPAHVHVDWHG